MDCDLDEWDPEEWDHCCTQCGELLNWDGDSPETEREAVCHDCNAKLSYEEGAAAAFGVVGLGEALARKGLPEDAAFRLFQLAFATIEWAQTFAKCDPGPKYYKARDAKLFMLARTLGLVGGPQTKAEVLTKAKLGKCYCEPGVLPSWEAACEFCKGYPTTG